MRTLIYMLALTVLSACLPSLSTTAMAAAGATIIKSQTPCVAEGGYCVKFASGDAIPVIRNFPFTAPSKGNAHVGFHGSAYCTSSGVIKDKVLDLFSQIVTNVNNPPNPFGPGGLRHVTILKDNPDHAKTAAITFNLAATRVVPFGSAKQLVFSYMMSQAKLDPGITCYIYNAAFSVIFASQ